MSFGPSFHSKSDFHGIFNGKKSGTWEYLEKRKEYLQTVKSIRLVCVGSFISNQLAFLGELFL